MSYTNKLHMAWVLVVILLTSAGFAEVPRLISYQGYLTDAGGVPVTDTLPMTFTIYDAETDGNSKWTETQSEVEVIDGGFSVLLGSVTTLVDTVFNDSVRYLGIQVESDPEIDPRTRLTTSPYAFRAETVDGATGGIISGDVSIQSNLNVSDTVQTTALKLTTNAEDGYTLISDGYGNATWQNAPCGWIRDDLNNKVYLLDINDRVGIGTQFWSGTSKLYVNGMAEMSGFKMSTGAAEDYILTSTNGEGLAEWRPAPAVDDGDWTINFDTMYTTISRVGIGVSSPDTAIRLHVGGRIRCSEYRILWGDKEGKMALENHYLALRGSINNQNDAAGIFIGNEITDTSIILRTRNNYASGIHFQQNDGGTIAFFRADGNIGIGIEQPTEPLHVMGTVYSASGGFMFPDLSVQASAAGWKDDGTTVTLVDNEDLVVVGDSTIRINNDGIRIGDSQAPISDNLLTIERDYDTPGPKNGLYSELLNSGSGSLNGLTSRVINSSGASADDATAVYGFCQSNGMNRFGLYAMVEARDSEIETGNSYGLMTYAQHGEYAFGANLQAINAKISCGLRGIAVADTAAYGLIGNAIGAATNYGIYATASGGTTNWAAYFDGDVEITGSHVRSGSYMKIDHPQNPDNQYLYHSSVNSPDLMNVYNGNITLDASGEAIVTLPDYFEALNENFRYQLTAIGAPGPNLYIAEKISGNRFAIAGGEPFVEVSWQVTGVRKDAFAKANPVQAEIDKPEKERGLYLHPEALGLSETLQIHYVQNKAIQETAERSKE